MDIPTEVQVMERGLAAVGKTPKDLCREAKIDYVTWWRWRTGRGGRIDNWSRVQEAYHAMVAA